MGPCGEGFEALVVCECHGGGRDVLGRRKLMLVYCSVMLGQVHVSLELEWRRQCYLCMLSWLATRCRKKKRRVGECYLSTQECHREVSTAYDIFTKNFDTSAYLSVSNNSIHRDQWTLRACVRMMDLSQALVYIRLMQI